eukprot:CAMPEP_0202727942 /NCGR_PEP_ID=MMETSP1385-20130828/185374_1 /ASSEMBLY_ACC=CAM_ASM_000861 /TAXON_ID=933848 /ORGANISM="Elphidium margaritaceum" /LENGTH=971 /DNA_ID=CAMNT_0049394185 /DNA_START=17 /DNA_END=2932 /DNA_ORIENTATION=+
MSKKGKKSKHHHQQAAHTQIATQELSTSDQQKLSTKYQNIFEKQVLSEYESENYRECIKQCDRILQAFPKNGETLAMKGLCLHCDGHRKLARNKKSGDDDDNNQYGFKANIYTATKNGTTDDGKTDDKADDPDASDKDTTTGTTTQTQSQTMTWEDEEQQHDGDAEARQMTNDGLQLIQNGLQCNIRSSLCWRVKALAHRSDKDWETAISSYKMAVKYDDENQRILTDLAALQIQQQKFTDFVATRYKLWILSQDRLTCIAYIVALFLAGEYSQCVSVMQENMDNSNNTFKLNRERTESNQLLLLQCKCLMRLQRYEEGLAFVTEQLQNQQIVDRLSGLQFKYEFELKLGRTQAAMTTVLSLIETNPENLRYHEQYQSLLLQGDDRTQLWRVYQELAQQYPKCNTIARLLLSGCGCGGDDEEEEFRTLAHAYLVRKFKKSVMSLYNDICALYDEDHKKAAILDALIAEYREELATNYRFSARDEKGSASPMCLLWVNYFYCSRLLALRQFDAALRVLDETIALVPTCIDLYALKGRLYKYVGNRRLAFKYLNQARMLDGADRYLNTKCVRYAFATGLVEQADAMVQLFLKKTEGTLSLHNLQVIWYQLHKAQCLQLFLKKTEGTLSLHNLQVIWYQLHKAQCLERAQRYGPSIKQYENIYAHFEEFWKNQTDFHRYAYNKCAIHSYLQLLHWEYRLRDHAMFMEAAQSAMRIWLTIARLQRQKKWQQLQCGSYPPRHEQYRKLKETNKKYQFDEYGWKLIHHSQPIAEANKWRDQLLQLVPHLESSDEYDKVVLIRVLDVQYLFAVRAYGDIVAVLQGLKEETRLKDAFLVRTIFLALYGVDDDGDGADDDKESVDENLATLKRDYDVAFLQRYFETAKSDADAKALRCVLSISLQNKKIRTQLKCSVEEIVACLVSVECGPMESAEIRAELDKYANRDSSVKTAAQKFVNFVQAKYPLQLKEEPDVLESS